MADYGRPNQEMNKLDIAKIKEYHNRILSDVSQIERLIDSNCNYVMNNVTDSDFMEKLAIANARREHSAQISRVYLSDNIDELNGLAASFNIEYVRVLELRIICDKESFIREICRLISLND